MRRRIASAAPAASAAAPPTHATAIPSVASSPVRTKAPSPFASDPASGFSSEPPPEPPEPPVSFKPSAFAASNASRAAARSAAARSMSLASGRSAPAAVSAEAMAASNASWTACVTHGVPFATSEPSALTTVCARSLRASLMASSSCFTASALAYSSANVPGCLASSNAFVAVLRAKLMRSTSPCVGFPPASRSSASMMAAVSSARTSLGTQYCEVGTSEPSPAALSTALASISFAEDRYISSWATLSSVAGSPAPSSTG